MFLVLKIDNFWLNLIYQLITIFLTIILFLIFIAVKRYEKKLEYHYEKIENDIPNFWIFSFFLLLNISLLLYFNWFFMAILILLCGYWSFQLFYDKKYK